MKSSARGKLAYRIRLSVWTRRGTLGIVFARWGPCAATPTRSRSTNAPGSIWRAASARQLRRGDRHLLHRRQVCNRAEQDIQRVDPRGESDDHRRCNPAYRLDGLGAGRRYGHPEPRRQAQADAGVGTETMNYPKKVRLVEVGPRDG